MTTRLEREQGYRRQTLKGLLMRRVRCRGCGTYFNARRGVRCCSHICAAQRAHESPTWKGEDIGYGAAHHRVRRARGRAQVHRCKCGAPAAHWAVVKPTHEAPEGPYALDPAAYEPMCVPCHKRMDLARAS